MELKKIIQNSNLTIEKENILYEEPMKKHTSFKIGGNALVFITIKNIKDLKEILNLAKEKNIPITVIGNGSNILVLDKGIEGITLKIDITNLELEKINDEKIELTIGAGYKLSMLARKAIKRRNNRLRRTLRNSRHNRWSNSNECRSSWKRNKRHIRRSKMH